MVEDDTLVLLRSLDTRTPLDESFDQMRAVLTEKGVTLEAAMQALRELRQEQGRSRS